MLEIRWLEVRSRRSEVGSQRLRFEELGIEELGIEELGIEELGVGSWELGNAKLKRKDGRPITITDNG